MVDRHMISERVLVLVDFGAYGAIVPRRRRQMRVAKMRPERRLTAQNGSALEALNHPVGRRRKARVI